MLLSRRLVVLLLPLTLGGAAAPVPTLQIADQAFRERDGLVAGAFDEQLGWVDGLYVKVNGRIDGPRGINSALTGLEGSPGTAKQRSGFPNLYVAGIEREDRTLCVEVISIDGLYEANATVIISPSARAAGHARIVLPSKNQRVRKSNQVEVAPLVRASQNDKGCKRGDPLLSSAWGILPTGKSPAILLGGNGAPGRPTIRRLADANAVACTELPSEGRSLAAYRFICRPQSAVCAVSETYSVGWRSGTSSPSLFQFTLRNQC